MTSNITSSRILKVAAIALTFGVLSFTATTGARADGFSLQIDGELGGDGPVSITRVDPNRMFIDGELGGDGPVTLHGGHHIQRMGGMTGAVEMIGRAIAHGVTDDAGNWYPSHNHLAQHEHDCAYLKKLIAFKGDVEANIRHIDTLDGATPGQKAEWKQSERDTLDGYTGSRGQHVPGLDEKIDEATRECNKRWY